MIHYFVVDFCTKYKINTNAAIILTNICYWVLYNKKINRNFNDGQYWMYNSMEEFKKAYPYMTIEQIRYSLEVLKKKGVIAASNYNLNKYNRTLWYSTSEETLNIFLNKYKSEKNECQEQKLPKIIVDKLNFLEEKTPAPSVEIPNSIWENSQMDTTNHDEFIGKTPNPLEEIPNSIWENSQMNININKPINSSSLSDIFLKIDKRLVFENKFYQDAEDFFANNPEYPPEKYISWLINFANSKNPKDLRAYIFTIFSKPEISAQFHYVQEQYELKFYTCPICQNKHWITDESCPCCHLPREPSEDEYIYFKNKYVMKPDEFDIWDESERAKTREIFSNIFKQIKPKEFT